MYKNQLQELAQRSCFCLPSYTCIREGPDHAPRFKATVNFNGEVFESPSFFTTLRQAEHAAAEVALNALSSRGPSHSLAARILDETGVYKNLLQEVAQRVGAPLPSYTTVRCGHGHQSSFTCTVELAEILFTGELAKSKKQAEKNAAMAAWNSLKQLARQEASSLSEPENNDELEQITVARALLSYRLKEKLAMANNPTASPFPRKFLIQLDKKLSSLQTSPAGSKILPMIRPRSAPRARPASPGTSDELHLQPHPPTFENQTTRPHKFNASGAAPYVPLQHFRMPYGSMVPPVTIRTAVPVFSAPPLPPPPVHQHLPHVMNPPWRMAPPVRIRPAIPVFAAPPTLFPTQPHVNQMQVKEQPAVARIPPTVQLKEESPAVSPFSSLQLKEQTHSVVRHTADHVKVVPAQGSTVKVKEEHANDIVAPAVKAKVERAQITAVQAKEDPAHANTAQLKEQTLITTAVDAPERPAAHSESICAQAAKYDGQEFEVQETLRTLEL